MTTDTRETSVHRSVTVERPIADAFRVFTEDMGSWWDPDHHLVDGYERMDVELREGGLITDHGRDGAACTWARVLAYDPPNHFAFSWDIDLNWQIETDPSRTSEVHVRFASETPTRTRVELEHRHLDRHGEGWEGMRAAVGGDNGWSLEPYAAAVEGRSVR
jgi:uncharacterized protein YndB with AHSA1/START domain